MQARYNLFQLQCEITSNCGIEDSKMSSSSDTSEESAALLPEEKNYDPKVRAASSSDYEEKTEVI